jgi:protein-S-isoprenylcysteine O-methyltransferase Ste14
MRAWPGLLILGLWLVWLGYWVIAARDAKRAGQREPAWSRLLFLAQMIIVALLDAVHHWPQWLMITVVPGGWTRYWIALLLVLLGVAFSIWARAALGTNWSGVVEVKVDHELVDHGPYRWLRHPIYTGMLIALLGTGLAAGELRGVLAFVIALLSLWLKSQVEERWMVREFGDRYTTYRRTTWALLPFIL